MKKSFEYPTWIINLRRDGENDDIGGDDLVEQYLPSSRGSAMDMFRGMVYVIEELEIQDVAVELRYESRKIGPAPTSEMAFTLMVDPAYNIELIETLELDLDSWQSNSTTFTDYPFSIQGILFTVRTYMNQPGAANLSRVMPGNGLLDIYKDMNPGNAAYVKEVDRILREIGDSLPEGVAFRYLTKELAL